MTMMHQTKHKLFRAKYMGTAGFYFLLVLVAGVLLGKCVSDRVKMVFLKQFHLQQDHFYVFAAVHFIPPMYSFANEYWYSHQRVSFEAMEKNSATTHEVINLWVNHYPLRLVTFNLYRAMYFKEQKPQYIYLRSRFMDLTLRSIYQLKKNGARLEIVPLESHMDKDTGHD